MESKEYLHWSHAGVKDGELAFVAGNPGTTGRLMTMAQLEYSRDVSYPLLYAKLESMIKALEAYGAQSAENKRVAGDDMLSAQNSYKVYMGFLAGLSATQLMARIETSAWRGMNHPRNRGQNRQWKRAGLRQTLNRDVNVVRRFRGPAGALLTL